MQLLTTPTLHAPARAPVVSMREAAWKPGETAPSYLDGSLPADAGCDPLCLVALATPVHVTPMRVINGGFLDRVAPLPFGLKQRQEVMAARTPEEQRLTLQWMREAELKHARLAMLAVMGWPLAELINPFDSLAYVAGRAPALLNGGLDAFAPFLLIAFAGAGYLELKTSDDVFFSPEYTPGDLGFDPLSLADKAGDMRTAEIYNGRLAMLAITGFAAQEFLWSSPVVAQTPFFFGR